MDALHAHLATTVLKVPLTFNFILAHSVLTAQMESTLNVPLERLVTHFMVLVSMTVKHALQALHVALEQQHRQLVPKLTTVLLV